MTPDCSVLLVAYNSVGLLPRLAETLDAVKEVQFEVLAVDNASRDGSADWIATHRPDWTLIRNAENVGFGRANNQLVPLVRGRYVLLLNTDAFMEPDTLQLTCAYLDAHPDVGVLGVQLIGEDGAVQPSARFFPTPLNLFLQRTGLDRVFRGVRPIDLPDWTIAEPVACDWVPGCYYLIRADALASVGLFDPRFFLYYEEIDHCRRIRAAGYAVHCVPSTRVIHVGGASSRSDGPLTPGGRQLLALLNESELLYMRKHHGLAGLATHLGLQSLFAGVRWLRAWFRPAGAAVRGSTLEGLSLMWSSLQATRGGRLPTR